MHCCFCEIYFSWFLIWLLVFQQNILSIIFFSLSISKHSLISIAQHIFQNHDRFWQFITFLKFLIFGQDIPFNIFLLFISFLLMATDDNLLFYIHTYHTLKVRFYSHFVKTKWYPFRLKCGILLEWNKHEKSVSNLERTNGDFFLLLNFD